MTKETGGQAFPYIISSKIEINGIEKYKALEGMSLRDWIAGQALVGELSSYANPRIDAMNKTDAESISNWCYKLADAMLKERNKQ